jgi:hypothetical protein
LPPLVIDFFWFPYCGLLYLKKNCFVWSLAHNLLTKLATFKKSLDTPGLDYVYWKGCGRKWPWSKLSLPWYFVGETEENYGILSG